ncbi:MAG: glycosyltransferase [Agathobacter sp.]
MAFIYEHMEMIKAVISFAEIFFVVYLIGYASFLFISVLSGCNETFNSMKKKQLRNEIHHDYFVPVSIIVPAYNEEVTIAETISSLLHLDYKSYEIIVVNDGSTDQTAEIVTERYGLHEVQRPIRRQLACKDPISIYEGSMEERVSITLINKENGGKADSINMGINASRFPYFICMDADSILEKEALNKIVLPVLENENVAAVGSMVRICNDSVFQDGELVELRMPKKIIPAFQVLEYERSFLASRIFLDKFNANLIVSGAFGLFKKEAVLAVGGYKNNCMGEDMELIMKLHEYHRSNHLPCVIKYAYDAVCWTQCPERLRDLIRQRRRWHSGLIQSMAGHSRVMSMGSYFYYLFYEMLSPIIELFGFLCTILAYVVGIINLPVTVAIFVIYAVFGALLTVITFTTRNFLSEHRVKLCDILRAFLFCIPEIVFLRFVMAWTRMLAPLHMRGKKTKWGKIRRVKINYDSEGET